MDGCESAHPLFSTAWTSQWAFARQRQLTGLLFTPVFYVIRRQTLRPLPRRASHRPEEPFGYLFGYSVKMKSFACASV
jgi:hypothetical protein